MSDEQRQFPRQEVQIEVELNFLEDEPRKVMTLNVSQGGLFMRIDNAAHYTMGEMVSVNFKNPLDNNEDTDKDAIIVRHTDDGVAVAFIEIEGF